MGSRPARRDSPLPALSPEWKGEPLTGKSLLLWGEQGLGDEIQAARFVTALRDLGCARITAACHPQNVRTFRRLGVQSAVNRVSVVDVPPHDYWAHLWSLPGQLGVTSENLSGKPYLTAPRAPGRGGVGVAVQGNPQNANDRLRSLPDDRLLRAIPGAMELKPEGDMLDSLAQISGLALVITVDTAWAHLAGAAGVPCWVLLSHGGVDWRWVPAGSERSPWYDFVRLFWQRTPGDWDSVITDVLGRLEVSA